MDPHPLPRNAIQNVPFMPPPPQPQTNEEDANEGWGHWAMGNGLNNGNAILPDQNAGLNNLLDAMEAEKFMRTKMTSQCRKKTVD
jgi:hypothetical protein